MEVAASLRLSGHVVAMPYPSRGHVNSMMRLCKLLAASSTTETSLLITFVLTQEWLGFIGSEPKPSNIRFATIPNVIPLQSQIASDIPAFFEAVVTNMEPPFHHLLHCLHPPATALLADVELNFPVAVARSTNIPVALLWTMSASFYFGLHHLGSLARNHSLKVDLLDDYTEHILGFSSAELADLRIVLRENDLRFLQLELECISIVSQADCLIVNTVQELEAEVIDSLRAMFHLPIYPIAFPYFKPETSHLVANSDDVDYLNWLDSQPAMSVLYISLGSFLSLSCAQMNEIVSALNTSGVCYFWVVRGEVSWLKEKCGDRGLVVPWCDQLKVLSHPSVGGFWSHCGWNSSLEAVFAGIPMLTFPLFFDQVPNSRQILEEWKNGWELKRSGLGSEELITQEEIVEVIREFMDLGSKTGKEIRDRALELKGICDRAVAEGGSSNMNLDALLKDVLCVP
ncbi:UDP-glycosyltransferase 87A2 [Mucuna pruriens]|uniref:UDP-glycosyltransferase 87A2 n=1 Tax=Mucuna pruriens TaxID=157652 RepID=A0A371FNH3_MUCPR|nr:UDP-glycosyltransferase 87A2 [Mucuna pruriens]